MKVLIVSANSLAASPVGPAYIAGSALKAGHTVEVFECLFAQDLARELQEHIARFCPDVIGISIRLVHAYIIDEAVEFHTRHLDLRLQVKEVVDTIRRVTSVPVILGGPGFNYYAREWLEYLDLDYGLQGEADFSFPLYLERLEHGGDLTSIPGCISRISRRGGAFIEADRELVDDLDKTAFPAYELLDMERYDQCGISPAILTKRGCAFRCMYCPYHALEGSRYRLKSPGRVVDEIELIYRISHPKMVMFCENNFNVPKSHAESICREIIARKMNIHWGTGDLRPMGITDDFCRLMKDSGCGYVSLSIESASDVMLTRMRRGYTAAEVEKALVCLEKGGIPYGGSLMLGAPGETPETIAETLELIDRHPMPPLGIWVTIGICLWTTLQEVLANARQAGQLTEDSELFTGANYMSPELPREYMIDLIESLRVRKGFTVQVNKAYADYKREVPQQ